MAHHQQFKVEPVCSEPKVFAGQIPFEATTQDVQNLFSRYGNIRSCNVITGPDQRSKGCAMILFEKWSEAELAVETENGTTNLGGAKPMVVKFADPPKRGDGPIVGVAPKKLFVGQIPPTTTEEQLRTLFSSYGNIVELHLLKKGMGAASCAFITFERWSEAEAAIDAHNGQTHLDGAKAPMVVKFADAKLEGGPGSGQKRAYGSMDAQFAAAAAASSNNSNALANSKKAFTGMNPAFPYSMPYGMGMGYGMMGMVGGGGG